MWVSFPPSDGKNLFWRHQSFRRSRQRQLLSKAHRVIEESLLVLQGLGIQTSTSSGYFFLGSTTTFIPTTRIQDIVIHEAFKGLEVRFYLAVIVEGATEVVVVFPVRTTNENLS